MKEVQITQEDRYAARVLINAALPLLRVVAVDYPKIDKKFKNRSFVFQVSVLDGEAEKGKFATYFTVENGVWTTHINDVYAKPDVEFEFPNIKKFVLFFSGKSKTAFPKMKGLKNFGLFMAIMSALLKMAGLFASTDVPKNEEDAVELLKLYFYLLPNGISQLNKMNHPLVKKFTNSQPDRIWALKIDGNDTLASWIRIKDGNSASGRGNNKRCAPFLAMEFDTPQHGLEILMAKADMLDYVAKKFLVINGAPEMAGDFGDMLSLVGSYAQATYLD